MAAIMLELTVYQTGLAQQARNFAVKRLGESPQQFLGLGKAGLGQDKGPRHRLWIDRPF